MKSVRCRPCAWFETTFGIDAAFRAEANAFRNNYGQWRYAQTNDSEIWRDDPDLAAVQAAQHAIRTDPEPAFQQLHALAARGSVWSMMLVGWAYETGTGVLADPAQAEHWFYLAAQGGCQQAQLRLWRILHKRGEFDRCEHVFGDAASVVWPTALYYIAKAKVSQPRTPERLKQARTLYQRAAAHGDIQAQIDLALLMKRGCYGLCQIPAGYLLLFKVAARGANFIDSRLKGNN